MTTPFEASGLLCRGCGRPLPAPDAACGSCGAAGLDPDARQRLARHAGRLRHAVGELRAVLAYHLGVGSSTRYGPLIVVGFLGLLVVPPLVAVASFVVLLLGGHEWWAIGAALSAILLQGLGLVAALAVTYFLATRLQARSRARARSCAPDLAVVSAQRCGHCDGYAAAPALGTARPMPCPWCGASLTSGNLEAATEAVASAIEAHRTELGPRRYARSQRRRRQAASPIEVPLAGFEMRAGLIRGEIDGVPMWSGHDAGPRGTFVRIEVPVATRLAGSYWLVRRPGEARLRGAAAEWGYTLPTRAAFSGVPRILAYAEPGFELPSGEALECAAARLDPNESLLLEPAGLCVWRHLPSLLMRAWAPLLRHHDTLAALAIELRA